MTDTSPIPDSPLHHEQRPEGLHSGCDCGHEPEFAPDPFKKGFTRRRVLAASAALTAPFALQPFSARMAFAAPAAGEQVKTAIFFEMPGGFDWTGMVAPHFDPGYARKKGPLALQQGQTVNMGGGWGMHPNLKPTHDQYWAKGMGSLVRSTRNWNMSHSHFETLDEVEGGGKGVTLGDGFVSRAVRNLSNAGVLTAMHKGGGLPKLDQGGGVLTLDSLQSFGLGGFDDMKVQAAAKSALRSMWSAGGVATTAEGKQALNTLTALDTVQKLGRTEYKPAADYGNSDVGDALKTAAQLIKANVGLRVVTIGKGGGDTHTNQVNSLNDTTAGMGPALAAFAQDLGPMMKNVGIVFFSEFGRTNFVNGGQGTDHGSGNPTLCLGGLTTGKIVGGWGSMDTKGGDKYDNEIDGKVHIYSVFGELLRAIGVSNVAAVFPGTPMEKVGAFK